MGIIILLIYMPWFVYLEKRTDVRHYMIHSPIDNHIPFIEYFIIPYLLWFIFIAVTVAYFLIKDKWGFYRLCAFLFSGMTIFLIICTVFPNALNLRPTVFPRDNMFTDMVKFCIKQIHRRTYFQASMYSTLSVQALHLT